MKNNYKYSFLNPGDTRYMQYIGEDNKRINMRKYKLWYDGDIDQLLYYYKSGVERSGTRKPYYTPSFLSLAPVGGSTNIGGGTQMNNFTIYHDPIATNISRAMSGLLFSQSPIPTLTVRSKKKSLELNETLKDIIEVNELNTLLQTAGELESYSGAIAFKTIIDPDFSDHAIVMVYPKESIIINKKYDKLVSIIFMDEYTDNQNDKYMLLSEYGKGYIKYKLIDKNNTEVSLDTIEDTKGLIDLEFRNQDNEMLDIILAVYKENKPGAKSDYENCIDDFQASDEIYSQMMNFIRKTGVKRVVSESTLKKTKDGNPIIPSAYDSDIIIKWDNNPNDSKGEVNDVQTVTEINNSIEGYIKSLNEVRENIARTVRLSIKTIMGKDESGANASSEALEVRENIDNKTRSNKLISWNNSYMKLIKLLMILETSKILNNIVTVNDLNDMEVAIEFYNPSTPTFTQMIEETQKLLDGGLIDDLGALERLWIDLSKSKSREEVEVMYNKIYNTEEAITDEPDMTEPELEDDLGEDTEEMDTEEDTMEEEGE